MWSRYVYFDGPSGCTGLSVFLGVPHEGTSTLIRWRWIAIARGRRSEGVEAHTHLLSRRASRGGGHHQYIELWWKSLNQEFKSKHLETSKYNIFEQAYFNYLANQPNKGVAVVSILRNVLKYPRIIKEAYGDFDFNFWKVFGKNWLTLHLISFKNKITS